MNYYLLLFPFFIALFAKKYHLLTFDGSLIAFIIGSIIIIDSPLRALQLIIFFVAGSGFTKWKEREKEKLQLFPEKIDNNNNNNNNSNNKIIQNNNSNNNADEDGKKKKKSGGRDMYQVLATGGIPCLLCIISLLSSYNSSFSSLLLFSISPIYLSIFYRSYLSTCCGDTLASEIGILSPTPPLSCLPLFSPFSRRFLKPGIDGGITIIGSIAAISGGLLIGLCELIEKGEEGEREKNVLLLTILHCGCYGIIGSMIDSMMGALFQQHFFSLPQAKLSKNHSDFLTLAKKWKKWNNLVNLLSSLLMAVIAVLLYSTIKKYETIILVVGAIICFLWAIPIGIKQEEDGNKKK